MLDRLYTVLDKIYKQSDIPLKKLSKKVIELSNYFNAPVFSKKDYVKDRELRFAYLFYFYPINVYKYLTLLNFYTKELSQVKTYLDVGAGPLSFLTAIALLNWDIEKFYAVDIDTEFMKLGQKVISGLNPKYNEITFLEYPKEKVNLINFGNVICEQKDIETIGFLSKHIQHLNENNGFLLIMEPGTKRAFKQLGLIKESLKKEGYFCLNPCPSLSCPRDKDWCHENIYFPRSELIMTVENQTGLNNRFINFCYILFSKKKVETESQEFYKVISNLMETKGSYTIEVCSINEVKKFELMKRDLTDFNSEFLNISRGYIISIKGHYQIGKINRLKKDSQVIMIKKFGGDLR